MSGNDEAPDGPRPQRIQDFIFARELAEVYLLLDHLSGRSDKSLASAVEESTRKEVAASGDPSKATPSKTGSSGSARSAGPRRARCGSRQARRPRF